MRDRVARLIVRARLLKLHTSSDHIEHVLHWREIVGALLDEELRAVRVRARVRHGQDAGVSVRVPDLLILELVAVDADAAGAVLLRRVAAWTLHAPRHA